MKSLLLSALIAALRLYVGSGLYDRIAAQVGLLYGQDLTGAEKMRRVLSFFTTEAATLGETLIRAVVEVVLLRIKAP